MKKTNLLPVLIFTMLVAASCSQAPDSDQAKTTDAKEVNANAAGDAYKVDAASSAVHWVGTKVSGHHSGTVAVKSGDLTVQNGNITGGSFVMNMASINTTGPAGASEEMNGKLTGHLHSADFFEVDKYPEATFTITEVKPFSGTVQDSADARQESLNEYKVTNPTHTVSGNLAMKGITKNIEFPARITATDNAVEAIAKFNIDRTQWNVVYPGKKDDLIRNDVHLGIMLKATK